MTRKYYVAFHADDFGNFTAFDEGWSRDALLRRASARRDLCGPIRLEAFFERPSLSDIVWRALDLSKR